MKEKKNPKKRRENSTSEKKTSRLISNKLQADYAVVTGVQVHSWARTYNGERKER